MNPGPVELLFVTLPLLLLLWGLPIAAAVWALLTLARMRRLLEQIAARLDALAPRTEGPR
jgi:hypothetical protein